MIGSISDILKIKTVDELRAVGNDFPEEVRRVLATLQDQLRKNILSTDITDISLHMGLVESWRDRVATYLSFAAGLVDWSQSDRFLLTRAEGEPKLAASERDGFQKELRAPFTALQVSLEQTIRSIDSRVNLCKRHLGLADDGKHAWRQSN